MNFGEFMSDDEALKVADEAIYARTGKHLSDVQRIILLGALNGQTYEEIAEKQSYKPEYLGQDAGPTLWKLLTEALGERVGKRNFRFALERRWQLERQAQLESRSRLNLSALPQYLSQPEEITNELSPFGPNHSPYTSWGTPWGAAPDVSQFLGRDTELDRLEGWIISGCRLLMIFGMPGVGKTQLAVKLARRVQEQFDVVIWRSLSNWEFQNRPPFLPELLENLTVAIAAQTDQASNPAPFLDYLIRYRCLIVLDGVESILCTGRHDGLYCEGYEAYGLFLQQVGSMATIQQSCLILTSQSNLKSVEEMEFDLPLRVRSEPLKGLGELSGREFVQSKGQFWGTESDWNLLLNQCGGNPLLLSRMANRIQTLFGGDIVQFFQTSKLDRDPFGDMAQLLASLFQRLSEGERTVIRCLAKSLHLLTFDGLQAVVQFESDQELSEVLASLRRRGFVEGNKTFFLQSLVARYVAAYLIAPDG